MPTKKAPQKSEPRKLKANIINEFETQPVYVNQVSASMSPYELVLRLGYILKTEGSELTVREIGGIVMTPYFAKALARLLSDTIQRHEQAHGPIPGDISPSS